ncbi:MAG: hypothetical protein P1P93_06460 [Gammaproteobacteria bacterium]|nr:hypothetical protein [Gammaproteobacteria bacterium]
MPSHRLLYALTAILLLMQAFAVWHDTSHPFHQATQECSKYEAVSHTPTASLTTVPELFHSISIVLIDVVVTTLLLQTYIESNHPIRAPPQYA